MNEFKEKYLKELEYELKQFLFLCGEKDAQILLSQTKNNYFDEQLRLACICMAFGYRKLLLKILAIVEKDLYDFLKLFDKINGNFHQLDKWINDFIENSEMPEARNLAREFWQSKKTTLDVENFNIRQLL
ncbi:MAG: hypothetical protein NC131_00535 [Roseburia sp.]|nr:hypothetical protein [Roseburia sp.]